MQVHAVAFVVIDARARSRKAEQLREIGVTDLDAYLAENPTELSSVRGAVVLDLNAKAIEMFGGNDRAQFIGMSTDRFFDPVCPVIRNASSAFFDGKSDYQEQARSIRLDGSRFDTIFSAVMRVPGGIPGVWLITFIDITEELQRRTAMDGLREELAHASRISILGEMSASIAHELGQPLSGISISALAASRYLDRDEPNVEAARGIISRISSQANRARDIMDRVRSMAGRRNENATRVTAADLVREAGRFIRHEFERSGTTCSVRIADPTHILLVDQVQIQQVIVNLMMNAIQMMRENEASDRHVDVIGRIEGETFVIEVADRGPGIPPAAMGQIFESFYSTRDEGLGLGLSICRKILEAHGGTIEARNRGERTGATFTVTLPLSQAAK